jgi:hypothetical protein
MRANRERGEHGTENAGSCSGPNGDRDEIAVEEHVELVDDLDVLTEGTPYDIVHWQTWTVFDWKTGRPENVAEPDDNLQLIAYGLATCNGGPFQVALVFLDGNSADGYADGRYSRVFQPSEHAALLARIRAVGQREQVPSPGDHCGKCYQRHYCYAYKARLSTALVGCGSPVPATLDASSAAKLSVMLDLADDWCEKAKAVFRDYIRNGGECIVNGKRATMGTCKGRESADVKALKADGMDKYIKQGAPFERISWKKE